MIKSPWLIITITILCVDQVSKWLAIHQIKLHMSNAIGPVLNFQLAFNSGSAFGFLSTVSGWQCGFLIILSIIYSLGILIWICVLNKKDTRITYWKAFSLSFILSGCLGNLIDRIRIGCVIDFINVNFRNWHWYTFNISDSVICIGAALLFFVTLKEEMIN